jgi:hypothetical protein
MNSTASPEILDSLEIIAKHVSARLVEEPVRFVRELAERWKERGGKVAGKLRHSDRYLDELLRQQDTPVRSLTPKLKGRTNLNPADARALVKLFLSHWDYLGDSGTGEIGATSEDLYKPMLSGIAIESVCGYVADRIFETETELTTFGRDTIELIATEYEKSRALFTVGAGQTMLVPRADTALIGFRDLMDRLRAIDEADRHERILIWTLDLGRQDFDDPESRVRFMNAESVISRFKALKRFKENVTAARWNWLQSRTIIVLHDTRGGRPDVAWLPAFDPHHVLFNAIPPKWVGSPEFVALYGTERVEQTNYSIFLRQAETSPKKDSLSIYELRYFGHALLKANERGERSLRGLELKPPGRSYVEALGTVFLASANRLGLRSKPLELLIDEMKIDAAHAIEKLRHHGFQLLSIDEFISL